MRGALKGKKLFIASNREPYMHVKEGRSVGCIVPAGGLVTALKGEARLAFAERGGDVSPDNMSDMCSRYYFEANPLTPVVDGGLHVALFLDFDGTLVSIAENPALPRLSPTSRGLLESILDSGRSVVTITSGRSLADLRRRASVRGAFYAGSHGLEISGPGIRFIHKGVLSAQPVINALYRDVMEQTEGCDGVVVEKKPYSLALHYRRAGNGAALFLRRLFEQKMVEHVNYRRLVTVVRGKKVLEIVPLVSWDKGAAALHVMERFGDTYVPVCLGDDLTDETLFKAFRGKGITIKVGTSRKTLAHYHLKSQREVSRFLEELDHGLGKGRAMTKATGNEDAHKAESPSPWGCPR
jgi:alpha,alpha-trehalase